MHASIIDFCFKPIMFFITIQTKIAGKVASPKMKNDCTITFFWKSFKYEFEGYRMWTKNHPEIVFLINYLLFVVKTITRLLRCGSRGIVIFKCLDWCLLLWKKMSGKKHSNYDSGCHESPRISIVCEVNFNKTDVHDQSLWKIEAIACLAHIIQWQVL